jgi:hypothetical protein
MAVYKIFPEQDAFISSEFPTANTGLDEILQLESYPDSTGQGHSSRILIKFSDEDLNTVSTLVSGSIFQAKIKVYLANASAIPVNYTVNAAPIYLTGSLDWNQGTGKAGDIPENQSGVCWVSASKEPVPSKWPTVLVTGVTASYNTVEGGGTWYTGSLLGSQTHAIRSTHDLDIDVTNAVTAIRSGSIDNKGFILKLEDALEFNTGTPIRLKYFGSDTNTIYPPVLELNWNDQKISNILPVIDTDLMTLGIKNNSGSFRVGTKQRFRLAVKPKYPTRTFSTTSVYTNNYKLPDTSLWALKDEFTEELIIDYNIIGTRVSSDSKGSYFDIYMNGLQPERYYRVLVKTVVNESELVLKADQPFKVVRNG